MSSPFEMMIDGEPHLVFPVHPSIAEDIRKMLREGKPSREMRRRGRQRRATHKRRKGKSNERG